MSCSIKGEEHEELVDLGYVQVLIVKPLLIDVGTFGRSRNATEGNHRVRGSQYLSLRQ